MRELASWRHRPHSVPRARARSTLCPECPVIASPIRMRSRRSRTPPLGLVRPLADATAGTMRPVVGSARAWLVAGVLHVAPPPHLACPQRSELRLDPPAIALSIRRCAPRVRRTQPVRMPPDRPRPAALASLRHPVAATKGSSLWRVRHRANHPVALCGKPHANCACTLVGNLRLFHGWGRFGQPGRRLPGPASASHRRSPAGVGTFAARDRLLSSQLPLQ